MWKMQRVRLESKVNQMIQNFIWKMWMIKLVFRMMQKVQNFVQQVQELLDKLDEGSHYVNGIEFMKVGHKIPQE